jgi:hypothetical protein
LLTACAPDVRELRLQTVRPIKVSDRFDAYGGPWSDDGVVAEFSTASDLRGLMPGTSMHTFFAITLRCAQLDRPDDATDWSSARIAAGFFTDSIGPLPPSTRDTPGSVLPRSDGRFLYSLPIARLTYAREQPRTAAEFERNPNIFHDLQRDADDICLYGRGWTFLRGVWRTNIVTIPYAAIRAALDASASAAAGGAPR